MGRRLALAVLAVGSSGLACASVIGLGDFEIVNDASDAMAARDGSVTAPDGTTAGCGLTVTPNIVGFGVIHDNVVSVPLDATFTNNGPTDITILGFTGVTADFTAPPTPFTVKAGTSSAQPFAMAAGTAETVQATLTLTTDDPGCVAVGFALTGQRTSDNITINPATVDLGDIPCTDATGADAGPPPTGTITITNYGVTPGTFQSNSPADFTISPSSGTVPAVSQAGPTTASEAQLTVSLNAVALAAPASISESIEVLANSALQPTDAAVQLQARVVGAVVTGPSGTVTVAKGTPKAILLSNTGNQTICVMYTLSQSLPGLTLSTTTDTLAPDAGGTLTITASGGFRPTGTVKVTPVACAGAAAPTPLCKPKIATIEVEGQ